MWVWALALALAASAAPNVTVLRQQLPLEETHELSVNASIEYILDFVPNEEQGQWPMRVWVQADGAGGGHPSRPVLVTYRQRAGAGTWQVPQLVGADAGARLLFELERTLCPEPDNAKDLPDCLGEGEARGWFSLHVVSACAQNVRLRAAPARDWQLHFDQPLTTTATLTAPRVHLYRFLEEQASVRLVVASQDDVCATVAVHAIRCPIAETLAELPSSTVRMTVLRSGGVQLSRERFPHGFYVVIMVHENELACDDEEPEDEDWLVEAAFQPHAAAAAAAPAPPPRRKTLTLDTKASLSRGAYAVAAGGTLALFAAFYAAFGLLVLAQRWQPFARHVAPKAVLAQESTLQSQTDAAQARRHRRDSTATFDSSDNSDSDHSDAEAGTAPAPAPNIMVASSPRASAAGSPVFIRDAVDTPVSRNGSVNVAPNDARPLSVPDGGPPDADVTSLDGTTPDVSSVDGTSPNVTSLNGTSNVTTLNGTSPDVITADVARDADADTNVVRVISSDGDQQNEQTDANGTQRPWGLPVRLRVAALARRRARVLEARSDRYLATLATVAVFYALPVLQFVFSFQIFLNVSGSLDTCYYNFLCAHPAGVVTDFNHVYSNLGYLLLGALFMLQVRRRRRARAARPRHQEYGIPPHYGLLSALGAGLMVVALLSASYHVCPNRLNFQFDTSFMFVLAVLSMVKIYQSRHPDVNARAHATFGVLAVLIALVVWGVLGGGALFWGVFTVLHVFTFLLLSLRIYYLGQFRFEKETLAMAARGLRAAGAGALRPLYSARLLLLLVANAVNWAFALFGLIRQSADFASHLLFVLLGNTLVYMAFYLLMKLLHGERLRWYAWAFTFGAAAAWAPALYLFTTGSSSWAATPARSRLLNHECRALAFYDAHDLWHLLSAVALYLSFNAMLTWDDGLTAVRRTDIAVF